MGDERDPHVNALLGVPTGEDTLSRDNIDDLEVSAKQPRRPGVSRPEYLHSGPGHDTQDNISLAGLTRRRNLFVAIVITLVVVALGLLTVVLRG